IPADQVQNAPSSQMCCIDRIYLDGVAQLNGGKRIVLLLNLHEVISEKKLEEIIKTKTGTPLEVGPPQEAETPLGSGTPVGSGNETEQPHSREKEAL
ncbi:MAG: hypothetical protein GY765_27240, partial [bacterium]|nr:hypothetical protein [bacterium]